MMKIDVVKRIVNLAERRRKRRRFPAKPRKEIRFAIRPIQGVRRGYVGKWIDESRTTDVCLCRPRVTLNPPLIDDYRRRRASIHNRRRRTLALASHSARRVPPLHQSTIHGPNSRDESNKKGNTRNDPSETSDESMFRLKRDEIFRFLILSFASYHS